MSRKDKRTLYQMIYDSIRHYTTAQLIEFALSNDKPATARRVAYAMYKTRVKSMRTGNDTRLACVDCFCFNCICDFLNQDTNELQNIL